MEFIVKKKIFRIFAAALSAAMVVSAAGCGQKAGNSADSSGKSVTGTSAQNENSSDAAVLADGEYFPDDFTYSGGSGKVTISCDKVVIKDGKAFADIVFSSSKYGYTAVDGEKYYPLDSDEGSKFEIPVKLNENMTIVGMTTAMSQPHEIEYEICVSLNASTAEKYSEDARQNTSADSKTAETSNETSNSGGDIDYQTPPEINGLKYESSMDVKYAEGFEVYYYSDDFALISVIDSARYLVVPEGKDVPEGLAEDIVVLQQPLDNIYLAASAAMALFDSMDALDDIKFSGTDVDGWYVENAATAMENGDIVYAGKYSEPDYELLLDSGCDLAIESNMITHAPEVKEMFEELNIPVFVDMSSYESHPLGRTEWLRLYGVMTGKEEEADRFFEGQEKTVEETENYEPTGKTVAFFYVSSDGSVAVRNTTDYIVKMIEMAGGKYIYDEPFDKDGINASASITMEEFYAAAADADYLIYNSSISDSVNSLNDLIETDEIFKEFKAVKNGNVWSTGKYLYQATDKLADFIVDIHRMLTDGDESEMSFLKKLK